MDGEKFEVYEEFQWKCLKLIKELSSLKADIWWKTFHGNGIVSKNSVD